MTESKFMSEPGTTRLIQQIKSMPDQLTIGYDESDGLHVIDGSITSDKLANGAVTTDKIANGAVTSDKIAEGGITGDNIANGTITADKLAQDVISQLGSNNPITSISGTVIYPKSQNEAICNYPCVYNNELYYLLAYEDLSIYKCTSNGVVSLWFTNTGSNPKDAKIIWVDDTLYELARSRSESKKITSEGVATSVSSNLTYLSTNGSRYNAVYLDGYIYFAGGSSSSSSSFFVYFDITSGNCNYVTGSTKPIPSPGCHPFIFNGSLYLLQFGVTGTQSILYSISGSTLKTATEVDRLKTNRDSYIFDSTAWNIDDNVEVHIKPNFDNLSIVSSLAGYGKFFLNVSESGSITGFNKAKSSYHFSTGSADPTIWRYPLFLYSTFVDDSEFLGISTKTSTSDKGSNGVVVSYNNINKDGLSSSEKPMSYTGTINNDVMSGIFWLVYKDKTTLKFLSSTASYGSNYDSDSSDTKFIVATRR